MLSVCLQQVETFLDLRTVPSNYIGGGLQFPEGIAIDWVARNIYWTDSGRRTLEVASIDKVWSLASF